MAVLNNPLMSKKIELPYSEALRECVHPVNETVTYVFEPKNAEDKKAILSGKVPKELDIFFHYLRIAAHDHPEYIGDIPYSLNFYQKKKNPYIVFVIAKLVDEKYRHLFPYA